MNLGFIGTGTIASSVITGIFKSKISFKKIYISKRNKKNSQKLKKKYKKIYIAKNNQEILDKCDWIFLSITPTVGKKIIKDLKFNKIYLKYYDSIGYFLSLISNILSTNYKKNFDYKVKVWNFLIPLSKIIDFLICNLFGKSLLIIIKK